MDESSLEDARVKIEAYIKKCEDASSWGGPTILPARPSLSDLKLLVSAINVDPKTVRESIARIVSPKAWCYVNPYTPLFQGHPSSDHASFERHKKTERATSLNKVDQILAVIQRKEPS